jgi:hypothetical protein
MRYRLLLIAAAACPGPPKYATTVSTNRPLVAKPATCDFRVVNLAPTTGGFEEIATLTPQPGVVAYTPEAFKQSVQADVCKLGGDLVVTEINGAGAYVRGTVLRASAAAATASP